METDKKSSMSVYSSPRLAAAYAFDRPRVHGPIIEAIATRLGIGQRLGRALDIGSGAGVSTAALERIAERAIGLEPIVSMLTHSRFVAPRAAFVVGEAERLPFAAATFAAVTAAGAINFADRDLWLPEVARVLSADGVLIIYDFSVGRRLDDSRALEDWYDAFERRFPTTPGYDLDVRTLPYERSGLRLTSFEELEIVLPMDLAAYVRYMMSERRVELALSRGGSEAEIRAWCQQSLAPIFQGRTRDVTFDAYAAWVTHAGLAADHA